MKKILNLLTLLIIFFSFYLNLNAISNISINNNNLVPEFNNNTKVYNVFVKEDVEIITINVEKLDNEIVTGIGSQSLKKGLNVLEIISYIDEVEIERYKLNITRGNVVYDKNNSTLKLLNIEGFNINFNEFVYDYEIKVNELDKLNIIYETSSPYSTVKVSGDIILNEGENNINIKVTSGNGKNSTIYKIKVYKEISKSINNSRKSFFYNKEFSSFELKLIAIGLGIFGLVVILVLFYLIFRKKGLNQ